jgi:sugar phosphate isomerase/epimerase
MPRIAVCSWSLKPTSPHDLVDKVRALGLSAVQLWLDPVRQWQWKPDTVGGLARAHSLALVSGMFAPKDEDYSTLDSIKATGGLRPDATWDSNLKAAEGDAIMAARFGIPLVTFHAGFIPHDPQDPARDTIIQRLRAVAETMAARNIRVALETGQEHADTLLHALDDINQPLPPKARVGVNFDPANMILYGMGDPVAALRKLAPHVLQVHIKDAVPSTKNGEWGEEKPVGQGAVDWPAFFATLRESGYQGDLVIERESGDDRVQDIRRARDLIEKHWR